MTRDSEVLNAIHGYDIPFLSYPQPRSFLQEPKFSVTEAEACDIEIHRLLTRGPIVAIPPQKINFYPFSFLLRNHQGNAIYFKFKRFKLFSVTTSFPVRGLAHGCPIDDPGFMDVNPGFARCILTGIYCSGKSAFSSLPVARRDV